MSGYTKLFGSILDSTVWELPLASKVTWIAMLVMADRDGIVEASIPGLAKRAGVSLEQCEEALASFQSPDRYSRTKDHDGRRIEEVRGGWRLLNYEAYREQMSAEDRRERAAERQRRFKERHKVTLGNAQALPVTETNASNDIQSQLQKQNKEDQNMASSRPGRRPKGQESEAFKAFYAAYPRRVKRKAANRAWVKLGLDAIAGQIMAALDWQKREVFAKCERDKIPHPSSWLNDERWNDERPGASRPIQPRPQGPPVAVVELAAERARKLEEAAERERKAEAERFKQQRERDAGGRVHEGDSL